MWFYKLVAGCALVCLLVLAVLTPRVKKGSRGVVLAAAMMQVQAIAQPSVRDQVVQTIDDSEDEAANGESEMPQTQEQQITGQAKAIRRGEWVERLRIRLH